MKLVTTTNDLSDYFEDKSVAAPVAAMKETGFSHIDLSMYYVIYEGSPWITKGDAWKKEIEECRKTADKLGFDFCQAHSPDPKDGNETVVNAIRNSIEACGMLGIPHTVVHALAPHGTTPDEFFELNVNFYKQFEEDLERHNVDLLIENSSALWNPFYYLRTGEDMRHFVEKAGISRMHICWDIGHGNADGRNQYDDIIAMGDELHALHVQDNFGNSDAHVMPLTGTTNFDMVFRGLTDIGYKGDFTFEAINSVKRANSWPHCRKDLREDDKLANPPLFIKQKQQTVMYEIGRWMLESYNIKAE